MPKVYPDCVPTDSVPTMPQGAVYKGRPANGEGGGFEISDIPGRGEGGGGVVCESSDVRKFLKNRNSKISMSSLKLKLEIIIDRDSNMRAFTYDVCSKYKNI